MNKRKHTLEDILYIIGIILLFLTILVFLLQLTGIGLNSIIPPCLFHTVTGYYCPGCGGTRAVMALFSGHVIKSILYHPIVLYFTILYTIFMVSHSIEKMQRRKRLHILPRICGIKFRIVYVYIGLGIDLIQCVIKNVFLR